MNVPKEWTFYKPEFEYHEDFNDYVEAWAGHIFFSYDLVRNFKPQTIAELGTYKGTSLYSYSQALKDGKLGTTVYAIDCWIGDEQTGFYEEQNIYEHVQKIVKKHYPKQNIKLMKMYFDEALPKIEDKSLDILHIDGLHTYEAVKHDYETWKSKVKDDGIIMFHDTRVEEFGVKDLWEEIKQEHPGATFLNFEHNFGLGVIFKDPKVATLLTDKFSSIMVEYYKAKAGQMIAELKLKDSQRQLQELTADKLALIKEVERVGEMANTYLKHAETLQTRYNRRSVKLALKVSEGLSNIRNASKQKKEKSSKPIGLID